jgi:cold shock CspA family protein
MTTMTEGRIRRLARFGYAFIEALDGSASGDVYLARAVMDKSKQTYQIGDKVRFSEGTGKDGRRFATSVQLVERAAPQPKPPTATVKRTGFVKDNFGERPYTFLRDEASGVDVFVRRNVAKRCGVQIGRGDRVEYEIDPSENPRGSCHAAVALRLLP